MHRRPGRASLVTRDADRHADGDGIADGDGHADRDTLADALADANADLDRHAHPDCDRDALADRDAGANLDSHAHADAHRDAPANLDAHADTPTPTPTATPATSRYDTYDTTGAVVEPGSYAFLAGVGEAASAITTYEGLRDGSTTALRIHETDADGVSRAAFLDTVEVGDLFEWRQAEDCFVRYQVTEVKPDPTGTVPRKLLGVEWMTFTYTGCSGAISASDNAQIVWGSLPNLGGESLSVPVIHGAYEIVPLDWSGETMRDYVPFPDYSDPVETDDITVARTLDFWREPTIPEGWTFGEAIAAGGDAHGGARWGYCATWWAKDVKIPNTTVVHPQRGVQICADFTSTRYGNQDASWNNGSAVHETRVIAGRPASLRFSPPGPNHRPGFPTLIQVFDPTTGVTYEIEAIDYDLKSNPEAVVEMARSLFEPPNPLPPPSAFRYDRYDTTGAVAEPGSYAFLADPADTTSAVTTYEGLRDGTTTALRIHTSDAEGVSRAAFLDTVEAGDTFEWREAEDCFVRYTVTAVKPDPAGTVPRKLLGVESIAYAFTGCSGAIATGSASGSAANSASSSTASITWGALPNLGGTSLTVPIVQGPFQLVPAGWAGATKPVGPRMPVRPTIPEAEATSLAEARTFPHWREPELPEGWQFTYAESGDESESGYFRAYYDGLRLIVSAAGVNAKYWKKAASGTYAGGSQTSVRETLQIAGRPAQVHRSITERQFRVTVHVWDDATGVLYMLRGSPDMATLIAFAESMFE